MNAGPNRARPWIATFVALTILVAGQDHASAQTPKPKPKPKPPSAAENSNGANRSARTKPSAILFDADFACELKIDGNNAGEITPGVPISIEAPAGEHILYAKAKGEDAEWRQVVETKGGEKKAVVVELKAQIETLRARREEQEAARRKEALERQRLQQEAAALAAQQAQQEKERQDRLDREAEDRREKQRQKEEQQQEERNRKEQERRASLPAADGFSVQRTDNAMIGNQRGMLLSVSCDVRNLQGRNLLLFAIFTRRDNNSKQGWVSIPITSSHQSGHFDDLRLFMNYANWPVLPGRDYPFSFILQVQDADSGKVYGQSGSYDFTFSFFKGSR